MNLHLAHEFVSSIVEDKNPYPNAIQSAKWTCVRLLGHESSMNGGELQMSVSAVNLFPQRTIAFFKFCNRNDELVNKILTSM